MQLGGLLADDTLIRRDGTDAWRRITPIDGRHLQRSPRHAYAAASNAAWILLRITCVISIIPIFGFTVWIVAAPVLLATFILSIVVLVRGGTLDGLMILGMSILGAPLLIMVAPFSSSIAWSQKRAFAHSPSTLSRPASYSVGRSEGEAAARARINMVQGSALDELSKTRYPSNENDQLNYRMGYRDGFSEAKR